LAGILKSNATLPAFLNLDASVDYLIERAKEEVILASSEIVGLRHRDAVLEKAITLLGIARVKINKTFIDN